VIIGEPSIPHFGATTAEASAPMSRGLPAIARSLSCELVEHRGLAAGDRRDDRLPQCVALRRLGHVAFVAGKDLLVIDLLEHGVGWDSAAQMTAGPPRRRRSAGSSDSRRSRAWTASAARRR
jgi:hypothetical protein